MWGRWKKHLPMQQIMIPNWMPCLSLEKPHTNQKTAAILEFNHLTILRILKENASLQNDTKLGVHPCDPLWTCLFSDKCTLPLSAPT